MLLLRQTVHDLRTGTDQTLPDVRGRDPRRREKVQILRRVSRQLQSTGTEKESGGVYPARVVLRRAGNP